MAPNDRDKINTRNDRDTIDTSEANKERLKEAKDYERRLAQTTLKDLETTIANINNIAIFDMALRYIATEHITVENLKQYMVSFVAVNKINDDDPVIVLIRDINAFLFLGGDNIEQMATVRTKLESGKIALQTKLASDPTSA